MKKEVIIDLFFIFTTLQKPYWHKKVKVGFSVDIETYNEFELYCNDNYINKSKLIDKIMGGESLKFTTSYFINSIDIQCNLCWF